MNLLTVILTTYHILTGNAMGKKKEQYSYCPARLPYYMVLYHFS